MLPLCLNILLSAANVATLSADTLKLAADYSERNGGLAVLVMKDGKVVFERYANGHAADKANHLHSATKSFWGVAIAAMIEDGLVSSFDEVVADTITEWKNDTRKSKITLRHLLTLTSGLGQDLRALQGFRGTAKDKYDHAVNLPTVADPGVRFMYGPSNYYALGEFMKRKLAKRKQNPLDYLKKRILDPIGCKAAEWKHDPSGNPHIPNGAYFTAREWAKYGQFLLQKGKWQRKQIVRRGLVEKCFEPSSVNRGHGLAFWLNRSGGRGVTLFQTAPRGSKAGFIYPDGSPDLIGALGAGKNRMYILPSLNLVVLRQCEKRFDRYSDAEFLRLVLEEK